VEIFSLGFGPALKKKWGQTEYRLSLIPLGGFVKMAGEEPAPGKPPAPDEFYGKTVGQRCIVFGAGVVMNILFGLIFFVLAYRIGVPVVPAKIGAVEPGSAAWKADLRRGDEIVRIGDLAGDLDFEDLKTSVILAKKGKSLSLEVNRDGNLIEVHLEPEYVAEIGRMSAGISPYFTMTLADPEDPRVRKEIQREEAKIRDEIMSVYRAGLRGGDTITGIYIGEDSQLIPLESPGEFSLAVALAGTRPIRIAYTRNGVAQTAAVVQTVPEETWGIGILLGQTRTISAVRAQSWADGEKGFAAGDVVMAVDGQETHSGDEAQKALDASADRSVEVIVSRGESETTLTAPPRQEKAAAVIAFERDRLFISAVVSGSPAEKAGLQPGDRIVAANGKNCEDFNVFYNAIQHSQGKPIKVAWEKHGARAAAEATITPIHGRTVRLVFKSSHVRAQASIAKSLRLGTRKSFQWIVRVYSMIRGLLTRSISTEHLSSPVAISYIIYVAARDSPGWLLYFLGLISINLGVLNLLPIPILDGGHILFAIIEKIRGKALSEKVMAAASYVGLGLLLAVFARAVWNDIWMFFLKELFG